MNHIIFLQKQHLQYLRRYNYVQFMLQEIIGRRKNWNSRLQCKARAFHLFA